MPTQDSNFRTICLLRHAKSSWDDSGIPDHDRPLSPRGKRAARAMGAYLSERDLAPDLALCSTAVRARDTWDRVLEELPAGVATRYEPDLYLASPGAVLDVLGEAPAEVRRAVIVGHNPTMQMLALALTDGSLHPGRKRIRTKYPTAALAVIEVGWADWNEAGDSAGELLDFVCPRDLDS